MMHSNTLKLKYNILSIPLRYAIFMPLIGLVNIINIKNKSRRIQMLVSNRNIKLITQAHDRRYLTAEDYQKWYTLYIINIDGSVEKLNWEINEKVTNLLICGGWCDHCINPLVFIEIANILGLSYDENTLNAVLDMWLINYLDGDIEKIKEYIPQGFNYVPNDTEE